MKNKYTIEQIDDFLTEHAWNIVGTWDERVLKAYIQWFESIRGLGLVWDGNELVGVACARVVRDPMLCKDYEHDETGEAVFVDLVAVKNKTAFKTLIAVMGERFGRKLVIAFDRKKYGTRLRVHNWFQFVTKATI
jgi:hypothetical protein